MEANEFIRLESSTDTPEDVASALAPAGDETPSGEHEQADTAPVADQQDAPAAPPDPETLQDETEPDGDQRPTRAQQRIQQLVRERQQRDVERPQPGVLLDHNVTRAK